MRRRSTKRPSSQTGFAGWWSTQFAPSAQVSVADRRLQFEDLEPRQMLSAAQAIGLEFLVSPTTAAGDQKNSQIAMDSTGDFVTVWQGDGVESSGQTGIFMQRYNSSGAAQGSAFQVNTNTTENQEHPSIGMDSTGDFIVAWDAVFSIEAQRYNAAGVPQGSNFRVDTFTTGAQVNPSVAMDSAGDFVIAWSAQYADGSGLSVAAQRYNSSGAAQGSEFRVNTYTSGNQGSAKVSMDSAGDFVIAWQSQYEDGSGYGIYAERYNSSGAAQGSQFQVNTYTINNQLGTSVSMDSAGDFVVAWSSYGEDGALSGIYARRYNPAGAAQGSEFRVNTYTSGTQESSSVSMDSAGDFVIAWQSGYFNTSAQDGSEYGIYAQVYNAAGAAQGSEFQVNTYTTDTQTSPSVAIDSAGDFIVSWQSRGQAGKFDFLYGVFAQRYKVSSAATQLVVTTQPPSTVTAGSGFGFTVTAEDGFNRLDTSFTGTVTVALASNPGSSTLAGTLTATAVAGVATFSGLTLNKAAGGYTLVTSTSGLASATTGSISVVPGP